MTAESAIPPVQGSRPTILHVTESFGGGTMSAIKSYVAHVPEARHRLAYCVRPESPITEDDLAGFERVHAMPDGTRARVAFLRSLFRSTDESIIVHAHSSYAGVYARLARGVKPSVPIVYTPHCFAFLRQDLSVRGRVVARVAENFLAHRTTAFAACSPYEAQLAQALPGSAIVRYVPNVATGSPSPARAYDASEAARVVGVGRIQAQKDPSFFAAVARATSSRSPDSGVRFEWLGDGEPELREELEASGVHVSGWIPQEAVAARLSGENSIYLHTARWEGFPMGVLEAALYGLPVVLRDAPVYRGMEVPTIDGGPDALADEVLRVLATEEAWTANVDSVQSALELNRPQVQGDRLREIYALCAARGA